jgi:hypothetical protein
MAMNEPEQTTDDSMVFDLCFGWVAIGELLMGDEEFVPAPRTKKPLNWVIDSGVP